MGRTGHNKIAGHIAILTATAVLGCVYQPVAWGKSSNTMSGNSELAEKQVTFYSGYGYLAGNLEHSRPEQGSRQQGIQQQGIQQQGNQQQGIHEQSAPEKRSSQEVQRQWKIPLRIWVSENPHRLRRIAARGARRIIRKIAQIDDLTEQQKALFKHRSEDFFADSKSRQLVEFVFDNDPLQQRFTVQPADISDEVPDSRSGRTDRNGLIEGDITLSEARVSQLLSAQHATDGWLSFSAVSADHRGTGRVRMIGPTGLSVVSDVDDTIKITDIPAGEAIVMRNTFFSAFRAVPCMAAMYQSFSETTAFHYVSGGPWQMYTPLTDFLFSDGAGFPHGSFHMKNVRTNPFESESYEDFRKLVGGSESATVVQKTAQIQTLLEHFPARQFVLIGDSGEKDPEIFRRIKEQFPQQILEIRIRDVVNAEALEPQRLVGVTIVKTDSDCD